MKHSTFSVGLTSFKIPIIPGFPPYSHAFLIFPGFFNEHVGGEYRRPVAEKDPGWKPAPRDYGSGSLCRAKAYLYDHPDGILTKAMPEKTSKPEPQVMAGCICACIHTGHSG
jgi:hypothetical protein